MTDEDMDRLDDARTWLGPTLQAAFDLVRKMPRLPDCAICPAGHWYLLEGPADTQQLECFCTQFRAVMFKAGSRVVTRCDAREDEIAKLSPDEHA